MAKVNLYISNDAYEKINSIIEKRRQEGAREKDVSFSATASMLLELGIESLSPHVSGNPKFEYANMVEDIREKVSSEMERFFPKNDDE